VVFSGVACFTYLQVLDEDDFDISQLTGRYDMDQAGPGEIFRSCVRCGVLEGGYGPKHRVSQSHTGAEYVYHVRKFGAAASVGGSQSADCVRKLRSPPERVGQDSKRKHRQKWTVANGTLPYEESEKEAVKTARHRATYEKRKAQDEAAFLSRYCPGPRRFR
jgi:hypothetical protein